MSVATMRDLCSLLIVVSLAAPDLVAQNSPEKIPADVFLPAGNKRTSEPGAVRVYKADSKGKILSPHEQPKGYPKTVNPDSYLKQPDEQLRDHLGTDYSSYDQFGKPVPQDFKAGVYGTVADAKPGLIRVHVDKLNNRIEYLHNSKSYVKPGDEVTPETRLGMTGNINPETGKVAASMGIHLHVQAKSKNGSPLNPDEVLAYARKPLSERKQAAFFAPLKSAAVKSLSASDYDDSKVDGRRFEVWGTSVKEPNRYRPWSESFATREQAQSRMQEIRRDHAKGGLLESDPDGPRNLEIRQIGGAQQPFNPRKASAEIVGTWNGVSVQGDSKLSIVLVFRDDGTVSNRAENGATGNGTWSRVGDTVNVSWSTGAKVSWQFKEGVLGGSGTTSRGQPWSISFRKQ